MPPGGKLISARDSADTLTLFLVDPTDSAAELYCDKARARLTANTTIQETERIATLGGY